MLNSWFNWGSSGNSVMQRAERIQERWQNPRNAPTPSPLLPSHRSPPSQPPSPQHRQNAGLAQALSTGCDIATHTYQRSQGVELLQTLSLAPLFIERLHPATSFPFTALALAHERAELGRLATEKRRIKEIKSRPEVQRNQTVLQALEEEERAIAKAEQYGLFQTALRVGGVALTALGLTGYLAYCGYKGEKFDKEFAVSGAKWINGLTSLLSSSVYLWNGSYVISENHDTAEHVLNLLDSVMPSGRQSEREREEQDGSAKNTNASSSSSPKDS